METLHIEDFVVDTTSRRVVDRVDLKVKQGEIAVLLGPNGAGKSELVLAVAGMMPAGGQLRINDYALMSLSTYQRRAAGIAAVPEGHQTLAGLSVRDNLKAAGTMLSQKDLDTQINNVLEIFPELEKLMAQKAGSMSGGQQQMLAIAQALICRPKFLLIDEMSLGLAPVIIDRLVGVVKELSKKGIGILLIEQFTQLALGMADYCYVLSQGKLQYAGEPGPLKDDPMILEKAYLGSSV